MKGLYVTGGPAESTGLADRLREVVPDIALTLVSSTSDALHAVRGGANYNVLFTAPAVPHHDALRLITALRGDSTPLAIVPIVNTERRDAFASAISAGADDVLVVEGNTFLHASGTLLRLRLNPRFREDARLGLGVLYAGADPLVLNLLRQVPFIQLDSALIRDGHVQVPAANSGPIACDVVVIDEQPTEAHRLQLIASVKSQVPGLPVIVMTGALEQLGSAAALDLGADDTVTKSGNYPRRLVGILKRFHYQKEMETVYATVAARAARLRQVVENLPEGIAVISDDGRVLAANAAALGFMGAKRPGDVVGREFLSFVADVDRQAASQGLDVIRQGDLSELPMMLVGADNRERLVQMRGILPDRDTIESRGVVVMINEQERHVPPPADTGEIDRLTAARDAALREQANLKVALETMSAKLLSTSASMTEERTKWNAESQHWQSRLAELEASLEVERAGRTEERERLRSNLDDVMREVWDVDRLRNECGQLQQAKDDLTRQLEAERAARAKEREDLLALHDAALEAMTSVQPLEVPVEQPAVASASTSTPTSTNRERELEEQLRQSKRLESVGSLAVAMLPELRTLLAGQEAKDIIEQLAAFAAHQSASLAVVDVGALIGEMTGLLEKLTEPRVQVQTRLAPAFASHATRAELAQLVTSLVVHGRDLLPAGGTVTIGTSTTAGEAIAIQMTLKGYGLQPFVTSPTLDAVVARCGGRLDVSQASAREQHWCVSLPAAR